MRVHEELKKALVALGERLGFYAEEEATLPCSGPARYTPRHDVVWSVRIRNSVLERCFQGAGLAVSKGGDTIVPLVVWEITGVDASTKTIFAELAYSRVCGSPFTIIVAPDAAYDRGRGSRGMNIKRVLRIIETYQIFQPGHRVAATTHATIANAPKYSGSTGAEIRVYNEYSPLIYRLVGKTMHNIRTDIAFTALLSTQTLEFLTKILEAPPYTSEIISEIEILGVEIEKRTGQKHMAGSLFYLASMYPRGIIVTEKTGLAQRMLSSIGGSSRIKIVGPEEWNRLCSESLPP